MPHLELLTPAKINLMLNITGRRADGYHELQTVFQFISLYDQLCFEVLEGTDRIELNCPGLDIEAQHNLVVKAARLLQPLCATRLGVRIELNKAIPDGAGLGGGSSDAAATLLALNQLWETQQSLDELAQLGLQLGADVPVFVRGQAGWGEGVGERLRPLPLPLQHYVLLAPAVAVSTATIFRHSELTRDHPPIRIRAFFEGWQRNLCEPLVRKLYPEVDRALKMLGQFGAARMSGTGSSVFLAFDSAQQVEQVCRQIPADWCAFAVQGMNHNPVHQQLGISLPVVAELSPRNLAQFD